MVFRVATLEATLAPLSLEREIELTERSSTFDFI